MTKLWVFLFAVLAILVGTFFVNFINANIAGNAIKNNFDYSFTKAVCDDKNFCQDYIIKCQNNKTLEMSPITGAAIQFSSSWKDPRNKDAIEKKC